MKSRKMSFFVVLFITLVMSLPALAQRGRGGGGGGAGGGYLEVDFFPDYIYENDTFSLNPASPLPVATKSGIGYDFRTTLGYTFKGLFLVGFGLNYYSITTDRGNIPGGTEGEKKTTKKFEWGPSIGFVGGNWRLIFTYFLSGERSVETSNFTDAGETVRTKITNAEMNGTQLVVGYDFNISAKVKLGPSLVYRSASYAKQSKSNSADPDPTENYKDQKLISSYVEGRLTPMISMVFLF